MDRSARRQKVAGNTVGWTARQTDTIYCENVVELALWEHWHRCHNVRASEGIEMCSNYKKIKIINLNNCWIICNNQELDNSYMESYRTPLPPLFSWFCNHAKYLSLRHWTTTGICFLHCRHSHILDRFGNDQPRNSNGTLYGPRFRHIFHPLSCSIAINTLSSGQTSTLFCYLTWFVSKWMVNLGAAYVCTTQKHLTALAVSQASAL